MIIYINFCNTKNKENENSSLTQRGIGNITWIWQLKVDYRNGIIGGYSPNVKESVTSP